MSELSGGSDRVPPVSSRFYTREQSVPLSRAAYVDPDHGYFENGARQIRAFVDTDWPLIWPIFTEVVTAGETHAYDTAWSSEQASDVWVERPPGHTVVACEGERVLGTAKIGPNRPGRGSHVATASFMVASDARDMGVGRALGEYALAWARDQGYAAMQFNAVVETNEAAVRLWQALGFRILGTVPEAFGHLDLGRVGLHIMHRYL